MRSLDRNKSTFWISKPLNSVEMVDEDGFLTGEYEKTYSEPKKIKITVFPSTGKLTEQMFGQLFKLDLIATWSGEDFDITTLFYKNYPVKFEDYDYSISQVKSSLNGSVYGLKGKVK